MNKDAEIVYEYFLTEEFGDVRITGWQQWNLAIKHDDDKSRFKKNKYPTKDMNMGLYDDDRCPLFVLDDNGDYKKEPVPEEKKLLNASIMAARFARDYPQDVKTNLALLAIEDKNNPDYKEFIRRKNEVDALKK